MKNFKSHFIFNKQERSGIFYLLLIILGLLLAHFFIQTFPNKPTSSLVLNDSLEQELAQLKQQHVLNDVVTFYPFNPNFISEARGYALGMTPSELDRLYQFRSINRFVNSAKEFQEITGVSDSLLNCISSNFKFPEWTQKSKNQFSKNKSSNTWKARSNPQPGGSIRKDLNTATVQDLKRVYGIGTKLSARIVKFRDRLGGFLVNEQLYDVYGLEPEVVTRALEKFTIKKPPEIKKININFASAEEMAQLVYISYELAEAIVIYREDNNGITTFDELTKIEEFPSEKIDRIGLYLTLKEE